MQLNKPVQQNNKHPPQSKTPKRKPQTKGNNQHQPQPPTKQSKQQNQTTAKQRKAT